MTKDFAKLENYFEAVSMKLMEDIEEARSKSGYMATDVEFRNMIKDWFGEFNLDIYDEWCTDGAD